MEDAKEIVSVGKLSGAVGTYAHLDPFVEEYVCKKMGLKPASISTQVIQRDRHAQYLSAIAITGSTLEKIATEIRHLQRTEVREVEEPFEKGQKGSSAMPHKRNPVICERVCGLARVLRANAHAAMENNALWHERDISHSSVERVIIPDSTILLDYMLNLMAFVLNGLLVYPKAMQENLNKTKGLIFSQKAMLMLVNKGFSRKNAYDIVQKNAMKVWQTGVDFKELLSKDKNVIKHVSPKELNACFDINAYLKNVNRIFKKVGV
jgi:adenylosuccinate lyase